MMRFLTKCAILLGGLYATGLALWHLGSTAIFVHEAVCIPAVVVDSTTRPFEGITEQLSHGLMPWEGDTAYHPHVRYELFGLNRVDTTLPDLDNREYHNGEAVEIILHPQQPHRRHLNKAKFLWVGDMLLLALGVLLLLQARHLLRRKKARHAKQAAAPKAEPAPRPKATPHPEPAPRAPSHPEPKPAPAKAPEPEILQLEAEPPAPKKRRRKSTAGSTKSTAKSTTRTRKKTDAADKPKTPRRRKKSAESA